MADQIRIKVIIDSAQAKKGSKESKEYILDIGEAAEKTEKQTKQMGIGTVTAGNLMAEVYAKVAQHAMQVIKQTRDLAFQVEETGSKYRTVLGPSIGKANQFLEENAGLLGVTNSEGQEFISTAVQIAKGMKMQEDQAADFGLQWTKLAGDFQSFFNVPYEEGFGAIRSGLTGETEPLKRFGIVLREQEVVERALLETGKERAEQLDELERVQARYNLIVEKAGVAVGDLERTQQSGANQTRRMEAAYRDIAEQMASKTIPMWSDLAGTGLRFSYVLKDIMGLNFSDELIKERTELNGLVLQLSNAAEGTDHRKNLIQKLNENYPAFLENLDQEKISNEELTERLNEANEAYREKIALQIADEEVKAKQREAASLLHEQIKQEQRIYEAASELLREHGKEIDLVGKSTDQIIALTEDALASQAKYTSDSGSQFANMAVNEVAMALQGLRGDQNELIALSARYAEVNEEVASALDVRSRAEERLGSTNQELINSPGENAAGGTNSENIKPVEVPVVFNWPDAISVSEDLKGVKIELEAVPKLTKGSLNELFGKLQEAQAEYQAATTDSAREMWAQRMEMIEAEIAAKEEGISKERYLRRQAHQEAVQQVLEYMQAINDGYQQITQLQGQVTEHRIQKTQQEKEAAISAIDAKLQNDKLSEQQRQNLIAQRAAAESRYQEKIDKLKRKQFERERQAKLAEIAMNTAVAVSKFWASQGPLALITQSLAIGMGIAQAAIVAKAPNPYLTGGLLEERLRPGMTSPGKKLISINENNKPEFIMNAASTARSLPVLNRMNQDPDFAERINRQVEQPRISAMAGNRARPAESSFDFNTMGSVIESSIRAGMEGVIVQSQLDIVEAKERLDDLEDYNQRIGN